VSACLGCRKGKSIRKRLWDEKGFSKGAPAISENKLRLSIQCMVGFFAVDSSPSSLSGKINEELRRHRGSCKNERRNEIVTSIQRENFFVAGVMRRMIKALSEYDLTIGYPQERLDMGVIHCTCV
jgi:hypothetical protein